MALRRFLKHAPLLGLLTILTLSGFSSIALAAMQAGSPSTAARIVDAMDETKLVTLAGQTHPLAAPNYDQGAVEDSLPTWQTGIIGLPNDGKRDLPDISLFASNAFWQHAVLFCMSDVAEGGFPCDYTNGTDTLNNSAGGTSFTAPQFASIQALINQKAGAPQGNPDPILYDLARAEYGSSSSPNKNNLTACNASQGNNIGSTCIFHDVTQGDIAVPCYGTNNCYGSTLNDYGILSTSDTKLLQAYPTKTGWDFATGLGSINVTNLVNAWP
jgi:hypothetical protein